MPNASPIRAVLTDIGNVVLRVHVEQTLSMLAEAADTTSEQILACLDGGDDTWDSINIGEQTAEQFGRQQLGDYYTRMGTARFCEAWLAMMGDDFPQVRAAYEALAVPLFVLSNTNDLHMDALRNHWLFSLAGADRFWASNEIGLRKPDPACYRYVLDRMDLPAQHVLFFDDHPHNIASARVLGLQAVQVDHPDQIPAALRQYRLID